MRWYHVLIRLVTLLSAAPAFAHALLERASPPVGSEVTTPPRQIVLTFTEGVEPLFSAIEVHDAQGASVAAGKPRTESGENRKLVVDLPALRNGTYTVIWHVTSVDTHKTEGRFQFTVAK